VKLLRGIAVAVGWLSGSLAGISAVVYACGYLITRAQLHLFGVSGFFPLSADHFMQEGAKFLVVIGQQAIEKRTQACWPRTPPSWSEELFNYIQ